MVVEIIKVKYGFLPIDFKLIQQIILGAYFIASCKASQLCNLSTWQNSWSSVKLDELDL